MDQKRVLIVESDNGFALSVAAVLQEAGFASTIALSAADAQREIRERRPDLIVLRAELPDLSGFAFCGRLRKDKAAQGLPIVLISSDATAEALAQHRSHPQSAADGYLQMPFAMEEMLNQVTGLLSLTGAAEPADPSAGSAENQKKASPADPQPAPPNAVDDLEGALDGAFGLAGGAPRAQAVEEKGVATATLDPTAQIAGIEAMVPPPPPRPPRLPKRPRRSSVSDDDRQFLDRLFESIADRKAELLAESRSAPRRAPVKRELLATPEGKLQILREELNRRESQVARLSEIWGIRERELGSIDDKLHEKEVEIQGLKMQVDDLMRRLADARDLFIKKDQEHGAALDSMLLEKFVNEKELIEVVAAKERDISLLRRDLHVREDELQRRSQELESGREEVSRLERARQDEFDQYAGHLHDLEGRLARRETEILGLNSDLDEAVRGAQMLVDELADTKRNLDREQKQLVQSLEVARAERDFDVRSLQTQIEAERARASLAESEADAGRTVFEQEVLALREELGLAEEQLSETQGERDSLRQQRDGLNQSLSARLQESEAVAARLAQDLTSEHEQALRREAQLSSELAERAEQLGNLEGELEALRGDKEAREAELAAELGQLNERLEGAQGEAAMLTRDLESARDRNQQLSEELDHLRRRTDAERASAVEAAEAFERDRDHKLGLAAQELAQQRTELGDQIERLTGELERTGQELSETHAARDKRESELGQQLAEKIEVLGSLEGELAALRAHAKEREEALAADLVAAKGERIELEQELEAARQRAATLGRDIAALSEEKAKAAESAEARLGALETELDGLRSQLEAATQEQGRLLSDGDAYRARAEARSAELRGELSAQEQAQREMEERSQAALDEVLTQREALEKDLKEKSKAIADWERRHSVLQVEKQRREEALAHEAQVRVEAGKASEKRLQGQLADLEGQLKSLQGQLHSAQAQERKSREEAAATDQKQQDLLQRLERAERDREAHRREAAAGLQTRDAKLAELGAQLQTAQHDRRKLEEEASGRAQRVEARARELELKAEQANQARERIERETQAGLQQRAKRIQDLEQAIEAATAAKTRAEKDLGARAQQAEAKAQELAQRVVSGLRVQKDLEARLQKEGTEQSQRLKGEIERREAQRQQDITRLQQALQEKSKQVKVMELELQRLKLRGGPGPSPTSNLPRSGASSAPLPVTRKVPPPPPPSRDGELEISVEENLEATQIMPLPNLAQVAKPSGTDDPEEDLDAMLNKLEI